jgi:hypothetical protein
MSELAFNINGEAFEVPANASGWRVRKMRAKGSPEVVYAREGQPLVLPISAEIADLRNEVDTTGRYRLDLVDQNNKPIEGAPSGYVQINFDAQSAAPETTSIAQPRASLTTPNESIVIESMRMQSMIAVSVVERFPQMVEAVATLLRAADGAGLPARPGMAVATANDQDGDDDDEGDDAAPAAPAFDFNSMLAQMLPMLFSGFASGKLTMPDLGAVFDWRRATPKADAPTHSAQARPAAPTADAQPKTAVPPPLDPTAMAHVIAIQAALEPNEVSYVKEVAKELSPAELRGWFDELSKLTVPQAVAKIRTLIAGNAEAVP